MYESFFNLKQKPFDLLPNPDFLFMSSAHKRAMSYLDYGIKERAGFILLTGEVGSGKTTIIRNLIRKNLDNVLLSKVFNTRVDSEQLLAMINDDFGLPVQNKDKITLLRELNAFLIDQFLQGRQPVLIIDEAQNLGYELLEEVRMLSNLETDDAKLLQIILVGQPELRRTLASPDLVQLRQRISISCHIQPLSPNETEQYILHRLETAGDRNAVRFSQETINIIYTYSRGVPRLINIICDFVLLAAYAEEKTDIDVAMVQEIIGDLDFEYHFWGSSSPDGHIGQDVAGDRSTLAAYAEQVAGMVLHRIQDRLEAFERETEATGRQYLKEMTERMAGLEESVKRQQERTLEILAGRCEINGLPADISFSPVPAVSAGNPGFGSLLGRMFRS